MNTKENNDTQTPCFFKSNRSPYFKSSNMSFNSIKYSDHFDSKKTSPKLKQELSPDGKKKELFKFKDAFKKNQVSPILIY